MARRKDLNSEHFLGLHGLVRLRWIAILGQILICFFASLWFQIRLPSVLLVVCIGFTALSNVFLSLHRRHSSSQETHWVPIFIGADIVTLTVMLYYSGGAHNPFTLFYLLHMTLAVILLRPWIAWLAIALCTLGFSLLLKSEHNLVSDLGVTCCNDMQAHLRGMAVSLALTGSGIVYFVSQLTSDLRQARHISSIAQAEGERARRSTEVATLAAGMAHELATPLGTIAIVSQDLEAMVKDPNCAADARVIRQEVERCRIIIEKLGMAARSQQEDWQGIEWEKLAELLAGYIPVTMQERLELQLTPSTKLPFFPQSRLLQCLGILIKNAVEAAPQGTPILLEAGIDGDYCKFRILDQGEGFPEGFSSRIGEAMMTTKSKIGGLGLGLYIVKAFTNEMNGSLSVESRAGGGSIVTLQLPLVEKLK